MLPGFVKLNSYLQQVESCKASLNLIHKELLIPEKIKLNNQSNQITIRKKLGDISLQDINFSFEKKQILKNFNLEIKNSVLGISGESGTGKSTLINILLGLLGTQKWKKFY